MSYRNQRVSGHEWGDSPIIFTPISFANRFMSDQNRYHGQGRSFSSIIVTSPQMKYDITQARGTGTVTSYTSIVRARANWAKVDIY